VGLVWYPTAFGNSGWEFGSITTSLNGLPLPVMGTSLILASAIARAHRPAAFAALVVSGMFLLCVLGMAIFYALDLPIAIRAVNDKLAQDGLRKAIARSVAQISIYGTVFVLVIWRARRLLRTGDEP
jgi:hypothetical protein